jgi:hypothetical protein
MRPHETTLGTSRAQVFPPMLGPGLLLFLAWTLATYSLEGRIGLTRHPTVLGRVLYVVIANVLIGVFAAGWVLRSALRAGEVSSEQLGFRSLPRTLIAVALALVAALGAFALLNPPSLEPIILMNLFAQVLPVSTAEVVVCWALIGVGVEALMRARGRALALVLGIVAADVLFGLYHFAHSAPFNQLGTVLFLMLPGVVTSLVYFLGRDIYAAIAIQNFAGMIGVGRNIDLMFFREPRYPLLLLALLSVAALIGAHVWMRRPNAGVMNQRGARVSPTREH